MAHYFLFEWIVQLPALITDFVDFEIPDFIYLLLQLFLEAMSVVLLWSIDVSITLFRYIGVPAAG
jgi:hypothetical protein